MPNFASALLGVAVAAFSAWGLVSAHAWPLKAKLFPLAVGIPLACLAALEVALSLRERQPAPQGELPPEVARKRTLVAAAWIGSLPVAIVLFGFPAAVPLFVFVYLLVQGRERWLFAALFAAATWALFYGLFDALLHLPFPAGWLFDWSSR